MARCAGARRPQPSTRTRTRALAQAQALALPLAPTLARRPQPSPGAPNPRQAPLSLLDYARPAMLVGFVASLVRYPAAFAFKAPVPFLVFASSLIALDSTAGTLDTLADASIRAGDVLSLPVAAGFVFSAFTLGVLLTLNLRPKPTPDTRHPTSSPR